jgi:ketosteroid isomerase-like protein
MREETADVVRVQMEPTAHTRRRLVERLALRFPRLVGPVAALLWRLPTRLRRALAKTYIRIGWEAFNRGDLDAAFLLYHPDCEYDWDSRWSTVGLETPPRGRKERMRAQEQVNSEWQDLTFRPQEVFLEGDRVISVGHMVGTGLSSGVPAEVEWVADFTIRGGLVVHERITIDHAEGLAAAGLA